MAAGRSGSGERPAAPPPTIVGGQPPGPLRDTADRVPTGLEALLSMAAAAPDFAEALQARPAEALRASGLSLTPSERAMLASVSGEGLRAAVRGVRDQLPEEARREFLGWSAAAMLLLAGGLGGATTACDHWGPVKGSRPDDPTPRSRGISPDMPGLAPASPRPRPEPAPPTQGIRPDLPAAPGFPAAETGLRPDPPPPLGPTGTGIRPDLPEHDQPERYGSARTGSRPDPPPPRPDAGRPRPPPPPKSRGISADLPDDPFDDDPGRR